MTYFFVAITIINFIGIIVAINTRTLVYKTVTKTYDGDEVNHNHIDGIDVEEYLGKIGDDPKFIKRLVKAVNEYQLSNK